MSHDDSQERLGRDVKRALGRREARTAEHLTDLLLEAKPQVFAQVELDDALRDAIEQLRGMFGKKERPRHLRHVHKMLRESNLEAIADSLAQSEQTGGYDPISRAAEHWRDRLAAEGDDALNLLCEEHPAADRTALRQAIRQVQKSKSEAEASHARRHLFVLLKELFEAADAHPAEGL